MPSTTDSIAEYCHGKGLTFVPGPLRDAQQFAQSHAKFLLVYVHAPDHPDSVNFIKNILVNDGVVEMLRNDAVCYTVDVSTREGYELERQLGVTTFPYVGLCIKRDFVMDISGDFTATDFKAHLKRAFENAGGIRAKEITFVRDREERETLRQMQERELREAEAADRERMAAKRRAEQEAAERRREEEAAAEELRRVQEEEARRKAEEEAEAKRIADAKAQALEEQRALALSNVPDDVEPHTPAGEKTTIRLMTLRGAAVEREFLRSTSTAALYSFAASQEDYDGTDFKLVAGFPPKAVEKGADIRIGDVPSLIPRSVVTMREL